MPEGQDPFTKELLAGEWEYYPGIHFISDNREEAAVGAFLAALAVFVLVILLLSVVTGRSRPDLPDDR